MSFKSIEYPTRAAATKARNLVETSWKHDDREVRATALGQSKTTGLISVLLIQF